MSNNSEDAFILNSSMEKQTSEFICEKREVLTLTDTNNGSYSNGVVIFDGSQVSNSGRPCDWANTILAIPTVMKVSGSALNPNVANVFAASWKNSVHMIDSLSVQMSNATVVETSEYSNIPCNFKLLTELSKQEQELFKYSYGFNKDNALSLRAPAVANNVNAPLAYEFNNCPNGGQYNGLATGTGYAHQNIGFSSGNAAMVERFMDTSFDAATQYAAGDIVALQNTGKAVAKRNGVTAVAAAGGAAEIVGVPESIDYFGVVTLPLKFLHAFFEKMPLVRNSYMKINFYTNLISKSVMDLNATTFTGLTSSLSARTCPYMVTQLATGTIIKDAANQQITIESGIGKLSDGSTPNPWGTACKLFVPVYTLNPDYLEKYFSMGNKAIKYNNYYRSVSPLVNKNGGQLNSFILTNGISRIRSLLCFPVIANNNPLLSPFSSSPSTTAPYAIVRNFNVRLSGTSHYTEGPVNYGWQTFQDEILKRGLNANLERSLGSGLLNELEWNAGYRFLYVDLTRKGGQGVDDVSKSVVVDLVNASPHDIIYHFFIEFEKEISVNVSTGQLVTGSQ